MFIVGKEYQRKKLHDLYGGQRYGGISTPKDYPLIMIFTGETGQNYGYKDHWADGIFYYTGEGQKGPMQFVKGNKAILEHNEKGKDIFLFEYVRSGIVKFVNQLTYIGHHFEQGIDLMENKRDIIVFHLAISSLINDPEKSLSIEDDDLKTNNLQELKKIALDDFKQKKCTDSERKMIVRRRVQAVKKYALLRANGKCEACGSPAPFKTSDNKPYLEVHHLRRLSDGGLDHPEHVAAICPNCHRRVHYGKDRKKYNKKLINKIQRKEHKMKESV